MTLAEQLATHIFDYLEPVTNMNYIDRLPVLLELKVLVDADINRLSASDPSRNR